LTLGVRCDVIGTVGITGGAGIDVFSCTTSSSLNDDESLKSDENDRLYYQCTNHLPEMIGICQWINI